MAENERKEFDPKAAAEARKAELEAMMTKLEQGVKDVFNGDNFKEYLNFCSRLPRYSINNQILIMMQRPDATMCQSFSGWKEMNRFVKKGEKGIRIMAPSPFKKEVEQDRLDANGNPVIGANGEPVKETVEITVNAFKPVSTFDISQTEGDPIPNLGVNELIGSVNGYEQLLDGLKEVIPVQIAFEEIASGAKGYFNVEENRIAVQKDMSEAQTIKT
ncbi:MAG: antirestriction protein, partial [Lachnospiraceae bacterium]|nr:antirestriction protein [Lachnospiraceae bacterium]